MNSNQWNGFIMSCLDILRNGKSKFDGFKAINEFITLITLKLVENRITEFSDNFIDVDENLNIPIGHDCKMSYLYNTFCTPEKIKTKICQDSLFDLLYGVNRIFDLEQELDDDLNVISEKRTRNNKLDCIIVRFNKYTNHLSNATNNATDNKTITSFDSRHAYDVQQLIAKIHESFALVDLNDFDYDAFGDAYEKIVADELCNKSKRNGQYYTKRDLIDLIIEKLNIKPTDKCYDPTCGTGGFILGFAKKYKHNQDFIKHNIYGQEYLEDVHKTLCFNMISHHIDSCLEHVTRGDSMSPIHHQNTKNKFDIIGANPPYGMSINCEINEYSVGHIKDSTALFLQHIYFSLKPGGKAGVVIDRGILNNGTDKKNSWETKLRKFLLENCQITEIIELPAGIFKHTNFATSVIFFCKGGKTTNINYIQGHFKAEDKGKGDKTLHLDNGKIITMDQIKTKNYSLKYDDYFKVVENKMSSGWIKLGDVCELNRGKSLPRNKIINGEYPVIGGGVEYSGYHNEYNYDGNNGIFISRVGTAGYVSRYYGNCYITDLIFVLEPNKNINIKFLYYYLLVSRNNIEKLRAQNGAPNISWTNLQNFMVPNLPPSHQTEIVELLDEIYQTASINDTIKYMKDHNVFNLLIDKNYDGFRKIIWFQENIPKLICEMENIPKKKNYYIQSLFDSIRGQSMVKKLGDIVEIKKGTFNSKDMDNNGDISFYTASFNSPVGTHSSHTLNLEEYIIFIKDGGNKNDPTSETTGLGKVFYVNGKSAFYISSSWICIKNKKY